jgi:hypothetical protein
MVREWKQYAVPVVTYIGRRDMVLEQLDTRLPCSASTRCRRRADCGARPWGFSSMGQSIRLSTGRLQVRVL